MRKNTCRSCFWWEPGEEEGCGRCRVLPPQSQLYHPPFDLAIWPTTAPDDWCSRHKLSEALKAEHDQMLADLVAGEG